MADPLEKQYVGDSQWQAGFARNVPQHLSAAEVKAQEATKKALWEVDRSKHPILSSLQHRRYPGAPRGFGGAIGGGFPTSAFTRPAPGFWQEDYGPPVPMPMSTRGAGSFPGWKRGQPIGSPGGQVPMGMPSDVSGGPFEWGDRSDYGDFFGLPTTPPSFGEGSEYQGLEGLGQAGSPLTQEIINDPAGTWSGGEDPRYATDGPQRMGGSTGFPGGSQAREIDPTDALVLTGDVWAGNIDFEQYGVFYEKAMNGTLTARDFAILTQALNKQTTEMATKFANADMSGETEESKAIIVDLSMWEAILESAGSDLTTLRELNATAMAGGQRLAGYAGVAETMRSVPGGSAFPYDPETFAKLDVSTQNAILADWNEAETNRRKRERRISTLKPLLADYGIEGLYSAQELANLDPDEFKVVLDRARSQKGRRNQLAMLFPEQHAQLMEQQAAERRALRPGSQGGVGVGSQGAGGEGPWGPLGLPALPSQYGPWGDLAALTPDEYSDQRDILLNRQIAAQRAGALVGMPAFRGFSEEQLRGIPIELLPQIFEASQRTPFTSGGRGGFGGGGQRAVLT